MTKKMLVQVVGVVFLLIGLLGFVPNPVVGANGLFATNGLHNLIHIISGILAFVLLMQGKRGAVLYGKVMAAVFGLLTIFGFLTGYALPGILPANMADNVLDLLLTVVFAYVGFASVTPTRK
jgi:hypothetical protein